MVDLLESPSNYLMRHLLDFDDIEDYEENHTIASDLAQQTINHLKSYLKNDKDLENVLQNHCETLVKLIHAQMQNHYEQPEQRWTEVIARNHIPLKSTRYVVPANEVPVSYYMPFDHQKPIKDLLFTGYQRSTYSTIRFDSHSERLFAEVLEKDPSVLKWIKPPRNSFSIFYHKDTAYEPDFVVETHDEKLLCEVKEAVGSD